MGPGVFGEDPHSHGVPVQPGQDVYRAGLARAAVVAQQIVGQGAGLPGEAGVDQDARRLVQGDEARVLIQNGEGTVLGGEIRSRLLYDDADPIPRLQDAVGVGAFPVDPEGVQGLQPPHQAVGDPQLPPQSGEQLGFSGHHTGQNHGGALLSRFFSDYTRLCAKNQV